MANLLAAAGKLGLDALDGRCEGGVVNRRQHVLAPATVKPDCAVVSLPGGLQGFQISSSKARSQALLTPAWESSVSCSTRNVFRFQI